MIVVEATGGQGPWSSDGGSGEDEAATKLQKVGSYQTQCKLADTAIVSEELW